MTVEPTGRSITELQATGDEMATSHSNSLTRTTDRRMTEWTIYHSLLTSLVGTAITTATTAYLS